MRGRLVVFCGIPGSGKTTIAKLVASSFEDSILIETDAVRKMLAHATFSPDESRFVYEACFAIAKEALKAGYFVFLDGTFLREEYRQDARKLLGEYCERVDTVWVRCDLAIALERNHGRHAEVPAVKVKAMFDAFEPPSVAVRVDNSRMAPESSARRVIMALKG
jgi:predicted kinase